MSSSFLKKEPTFLEKIFSPSQAKKLARDRDSLASELYRVNGENSELKSEVVSLTAKYEHLKLDQSQLKSEYATIKAQKTELKSKVREMEQKAHDSEEVIAKMKAVYDRMKIYETELKSEHTTLTAKYEHLKLDYGEWKDKLATMKVENDRMKYEKNEMNSKFYADKADQKAPDIEEFNAAMNAQIGRLNSENTELKLKVHRIEDEAIIKHTTTKAENDQLKSEVHEMQQKLREVSEMIIELKITVDEKTKNIQLFEQTQFFCKKPLYIRANNGYFINGENGNYSMYCNYKSAGPNKIFVIEQFGASTVALRSSGKYLSSEDGKKAMNCDRGFPKEWECFEIIHHGGNAFSLKGNNGKFVSNKGCYLYCDASDIGKNETFYVSIY